MKQRLPALLLALVAIGAAPLGAQTAESTAPLPLPPPPPAGAATASTGLSWTLSPTFVTTYMFRGQRLGGQSLQPSLEADYGNLALGVWSSDPVNNDNKVTGQSDPEIDPYGSYIFNLDSHWSIQPGFTWYTYFKAPTYQGFYRETFEPNIAVNYAFDGLKLTPKYYYDVVMDTSTYEFDAAYAVPLKGMGSEFDFNGSVGTYLGTDVINTANYPLQPKTSSWGNYWLVGVSMPFTLTPSIKLTLGWAYTEGSGAFVKTGTLPKAQNTEAVGRGVGTGAFVWTF